MLTGDPLSTPFKKEGEIMFRKFRGLAIRGNAGDMAVGIVIGPASGRIIKSLVENILMPPISLITGGVDFPGFS